MMRKFDETYFQRSYTDYRRQNPARKTAWYRRVVQRWVNGTAGARVLDIGCGPGLLLGALPAAWERCGVDPAHDVLRKSHRTLPGVRFCGGEIEHLPFSQCFDAVTSLDVLEHAESLDAVARSIHSVLVPGGIFIFVVPVNDGPAGLLVTLLDKDPTHLHHLSRNTWLKWTAQHFSVLWWCGITRRLLFKRWYLHLPTRAARCFTPAILVVARK